MILEFPSFDVLQAVLREGLLPPAVTGAAAQVARFEDGRTRIRAEGSITRRVADVLRRRGVSERRFVRMPGAVSVRCWWELIPLERAPGSPPAAPGQSVLFLLPAGPELASFVAEMLRLGNSGQSFRHVELDGQEWTLLKVSDPPYYTLLRAAERSRENGARRVAAQQAPRHAALVEIRDRVWMEAGCRHPLAERVEAPPDGQSLLIRDGHAWQAVPEAPFQLVERAAAWQAPDIPESGREAKPPRIRLPLRLAPAAPGPTPAAEMWILEREPLAQLEALVRTSDNRLLERLTFALGACQGRQIVAIRAAQAKGAMPVLVLDGLALRPYLRLSHVYIPVARRLMPELRRDAAARWLGENDQQVTWLRPRETGSFSVESLPQEAFRPFTQWVEYRVDAARVEVSPWTAPDRFEFERFVCGAEEQERQDARQQRAEEETERTPREPRRKRPVPVPAPKSAAEAPLKLPPLGEREARLRALEEAFHGLEGPLDDPQRLPLWSELAVVLASLGQRFDASLCWSHCLWDRGGEDRASRDAWLSVEQTSTEGRPAHAHDPSRDEFWRRWTAGQPSDLIGLVPHLLELASRPDGRALVVPRLAALQKAIHAAEPHLPVRIVWLLWRSIAELSGGDVLALAKARDRVLERLYHQGLKAEFDLPGFLRRSAVHDRDRFRSIRTHVRELHQLARRWTRGPAPATAHTPEYVDLLFAYGLARLGEAVETQELLQSAEILSAGDPVHAWLHDAFVFRVAEIRAGQFAAGVFPPELQARLEALDKTERYKVDRLREQSRILEPHERIDASRGWRGRHGDELDRQLIALSEIAAEPEKLRKQLDKLLADKGNPQRTARLLAKGLELAPRLGSDYAERLLERTTRELERKLEVRVRTQLLEKALFLAAHLGRSSRVAELVGHLDQVLEGLEGEELPRTIDSLLGQCCQGLRKFGLRDEMTVLFERVGERTLTGTSGSASPWTRFLARGDKSAEVRATAGSLGGAQRWNRTSYGKHGPELSVLMHLASGWFYFGRAELGQAALDEVRDVLQNGQLKPDHQTAVALAYVRTLGHAPTELAVARLEELFRSISGVSDTHLSQSHYARSQLTVVEAAVLALVSDEQLVDAASRQRLDEDEFLVRRRIHRDVEQAMQSSGMSRPQPRK